MITAARQREIDRKNIHLPQTATVGIEDISRGITTPKQKKQYLLGGSKSQQNRNRPKPKRYTAGRARPSDVTYIGGERGKAVQDAAKEEIEELPDDEVATVENPDDPRIIKKKKDKGLLT